MSQATTKDLRRRNRATVLRQIILNPGTSRLDLARSAGVSMGTVTNVVADLQSEGLVHEAGSKPSRGGRPTAVLSVVNDAVHFIGVDVGELGVTAELFNLSLECIGHSFHAVGSRQASPGELAAVVTASVEELTADSEVANSVYGIGLGLPGIVELSPSGPVLHAQSIGWEPTPITAFTSPGYPTFAHNGAATLALTEQWLGSARDTPNAVVALLGRGVGAGIISAGRIVEGTLGSAAEWGHTVVKFGGRSDAAGIPGTLEAYVGGSAIIERWREMGAEYGSDDEAALDALLAAAKSDDEVARSLVFETIEILGAGIANLVNLFNPQKVILGGWAGLRLFEAFPAELREAAFRYTMRIFRDDLNVSATRFGRDAVALGAALLAVDNFVSETSPSNGNPARFGE